MSRFKIIVLFIFLVTLMGASGTFAGTHQHHHEGHDSSVASPFDNKQEGNSAHCLLNNHQHKDEFCPHTVPLDKDKSHRLSVDCGGKTNGTTPLFSFHKDNIVNSYSIAGLRNFSFKLFAVKFSTTQLKLNSQDPPPEIL